MAAQQGLRSTDLRVLEDALGIGLTTSGDTVDSLSADGAYYLEQVTITETSEDDYEYEEIPDDNFSVPEGDEDLIKAVQLVQEKVTDTHILEQKTVLPSKYQVPEVIEDFLCNFLIKMGMTRTLDCFQSEWYEHIQKGITELRAFGNVPDVYTQNMILESENKILKKDLKHFKEAADKARSELLKTQKERDFHRMHHKRLVQEKNKLVSDLKGLKLHYASYEPTIRVLHEKHQNLLRQKMLTSLEKDRAVGQESEFANDVEQSTSLNLSNETVSSKLDFTLNNVFRIHDLPVSCVVMHPHAKLFASCGEDHLWKMIEIPNGNVLLNGFGHTDWLSDCCFYINGHKLVTSSGDTTVKLWELSKGDCILTFKGHGHIVWSCSWDISGDFVASSSLDATSKIWDVNSERCKCTLHGHRESVNTIEFFPCSNILLTGSADKTLSVWDVRTGICEHSLYGHIHSINDATFSPMGHMIASSDACGVIKLWDFRKLLPIVSIDVGPSPSNEVNFDPMGRVLAQASSSGAIHLLDLKSGEIRKMMGHESEAHTVVFSHDGENLFSGDSDGTVRMWA
ncbi:sperm-associated antigen 16 protein [Suncus etruscus]|uniref:sperm-associated antigen 16 protein n=1 Tax=Suncus etruscus TaxID=109475 RepID=UPI00210F75FD|nr:sperm-associated antigen 16 protein [Suncus etruscus]